MLVSSISTTFTGSGKDVSIAINNAISSINHRDKRYVDFLQIGKSRIESFYETNYLQLIHKAQTLAAQQCYEEVLSVLALYPVSLPSYSRISPVLISIYQQYQSSRCKKAIQEAKGYIAMKDYEAAVNVLTTVDPGSECKNESLNLLVSVKKYVDQEERELIDRRLTYFNSMVNLEKYRLAAIRDVAKSYYSHQPSIHYTQVIR